MTNPMTTKDLAALAEQGRLIAEIKTYLPREFHLAVDRLVERETILALTARVEALERLREADLRLDAAEAKLKVSVEKRKFGNRPQLQANVDAARNERRAALNAKDVT